MVVGVIVIAKASAAQIAAFYLQLLGDGAIVYRFEYQYWLKKCIHFINSKINISDNVKCYVIERDSSTEFGIHVLDSKPAIISGIDAGNYDRVATKLGILIHSSASTVYSSNTNSGIYNLLC